MTKPVLYRGRTRRAHNEQFKQELVDLCVKPGMSLASVAKQHSVHPNLLSRWVKERTGSARTMVPSQPSPVPEFVPVHLESARVVQAPQLAPASGKVEVNIDRGDMRIAFKVDPSQMVELGQMLREVLR